MLTYNDQLELTEIVRQYARALINYYEIPPYEYPKSLSESNEIIEFGKTTRHEVKKARKKKEDSDNRTANNYKHSIMDIIRAGGKSYTDEEMLLLAERARRAIRQASKLAGEPVVYCCGLLRIKSRINYECTCEQSKRHTIINSLEGSYGVGTSYEDALV